MVVNQLKSIGDEARDFIMNNLEFRLSLATNDFVILPPYLTHMIELGIASSDRISFVGDILLTELEYKSSMFLPPMNIWQELE